MDIIGLNEKGLYYIGGIVRDELLGLKSRDIDITYVGNAIEYCSKFGKVIQKNPEFGTIRVNVEGKEIDFASTRSEIYPKKGHLPIVEKIGCSLKEDVMRRDFTVNALAKSVSTGEIIDYVGGLKDLKNKKLRVLYDESFIDDPTRIIRGLKFSVRFGFCLEEHTQKLQDKYLKNINYDMSYKRVKKELIETFNPLPNFIRSYSDKGEITSYKGRGQLAFEKFINEKIYKLVTPKDVKLPKIDVENLINQYGCEHIWLVYVGVLGDLSRLPLTKVEQKILDDMPQIEPKNDFEIYKMFENCRIETILLYAILKNEKIARHYLDDLRNIKIEITGEDLKNLGFKPSPKYQKIFDKILREKIKNPKITKNDEIKIAAEFSVLDS